MSITAPRATACGFSSSGWWTASPPGPAGTTPSNRTAPWPGAPPLTAWVEDTAPLRRIDSTRRRDPSSWPHLDLRPGVRTARRTCTRNPEQPPCTEPSAERVIRSGTYYPNHSAHPAGCSASGTGGGGPRRRHRDPPRRAGIGAVEAQPVRPWWSGTDASDADILRHAPAALRDRTYHRPRQAAPGRTCLPIRSPGGARRRTWSVLPSPPGYVLPAAGGGPQAGAGESATFCPFIPPTGGGMTADRGDGSRDGAPDDRSVVPRCTCGLRGDSRN